MQKRAEITRGNILRAARKLFAKHGYHGTSVDKIAELAKANKQRIYAYFGSKAKLFETVLVDAYRETNRLEPELERALLANPTKLTGTLLNHFINLHRNHPDFWRLITWANLEEEPFHKAVKNINAGTMRIVRPFFDDAKTRGDIPSGVSFEVYMFDIFAVSYFYHSNRMTLSNTLTPDIFGPGGIDRVVEETASLIHD